MSRLRFPVRRGNQPAARRRSTASGALAIALASAAALIAATTPGALAAGELITGGPTGPTTDNTPTFSWEAVVPASCAIDGAAPTPCTSPFTTPELADGPHVVEIQAGVAIEARNIVVDTIVPAVIVTGSDAVQTEPTTTVTFTAEAGAETSCAIDSGDFAPCESPYTTPVLRNGTHVVRVRATDAAGNHGEGSHVVRMDVAPPDTSIVAGPGDYTDELRPWHGVVRNVQGDWVLLSHDLVLQVFRGVAPAHE